MAKKDYTNWDRKDLIKEIEQLRKRKKYGLVWEDKQENVVEQCKTELPVLEEVKDKEIITDPDKPVNLLIEGDNYHALSVLNYTHKSKIDVIYIDPPYNTGNKDFVYNDQYVDKEDAYRHSKWISFMEKRLSLAKPLLKTNGAIFVSIDDNEYPRLMMLMEEIFGENKLKTVCVKMSEATGVKMASVIKNGRIPKLKEYLVIAKRNGIKDLYLEKLPKEQWDSEYKTIILNTTEQEINKIKEIRDNEERTKEDINFCNQKISNWKTSSLSEYFSQNNISKKEQDDFKYKNAWRILQIATLTGGSRDKAAEIKNSFSKKVPAFFCLTTPQKKMYLISGTFNHETKLPRCKVLFADDYLTIHPGDFWTDIKTTGLDNEGGVDFKNGKKPIKLLEKIVKTYENKNITVLDFFAGSGTSAEAVLKLNNEDKGNRKFILCSYNEENGNGKIVDEYCYPRVEKAIRGYNTKKGYGGNLKYYKTAFVPADPTDKNKIAMTEKATEMLCVKEDTFEEVKSTKQYKIFRSKKRYTGIVFDHQVIDDFKKEISKIDGKFSLYIFSLGDDTFDEEFEDMKKKVKLSPIPEAILRVYRRIFK
jgi:adenine-specific DNA-methyltransferase